SRTSGRARSSHQVTLSSRAFRELTFHVAIRMDSKVHRGRRAGKGRLDVPARPRSRRPCARGPPRSRGRPSAVWLALQLGAGARAGRPESVSRTTGADVPVRMLFA